MIRTHALVRLGVLAAGVVGGGLVGGRAVNAVSSSARCDSGREVLTLGPAPASALEATTSVAWAASGLMMATGRRDGAVCLWDRDGTPAGRWVALDAPVNTVCFVGDHSALLSAGGGEVVRLWEHSGAAPALRAEVRTLDRILCAAASPDGQTLAIGHFGVISLRRVGPGQLTPTGRLNTPNHRTFALALAPDGRTLAAGSCGDGLVRLWRLGDTSPPECLDSSDEYQVRGLAFSTDGRTLFATPVGRSPASPARSRRRRRSRSPTSSSAPADGRARPPRGGSYGSNCSPPWGRWTRSTGRYSLGPPTRRGTAHDTG